MYRGADGNFTLYEDENDTYHYEKGMYTTIPFHWDDAADTLTVGDRQGAFPGMLERRTFRIVFAREQHGIGIEPEPTADRVLTYEGKQITVQAP